jgi:hypothetical protein
MRGVSATTVVVEKQLSITHSECVIVALVFEHALRMSHTVICSLSGSTQFFHIVS